MAARLAAHWGERVPRGAAAVVFVAVLLSALATEAIGIHALFGAFLLGAVIPHDSGLARAFKHKLEDVVTVLLLPAFFAFSGLRTSIGLVSGWGWLTCAVIVLAATLGKFGGTLAAARWTGQSWRNATALGLLMNTRGLMELIVLGVGLEMGVISDTLYAMMVVMALVTTLATTPLLALLQGRQRKDLETRDQRSEIRESVGASTRPTARGMQPLRGKNSPGNMLRQGIRRVLLYPEGVASSSRGSRTRAPTDSRDDLVFFHNL